MMKIAANIEKYSIETNELPLSFEDVPSLDKKDLNDGWGNKIIYIIHSDNTVTILSSGRDGESDEKNISDDFILTFNPKEEDDFIKKGVQRNK